MIMKVFATQWALSEALIHATVVPQQDLNATDQRHSHQSVP